MRCKCGSKENVRLYFKNSPAPEFMCLECARSVYESREYWYQMSPNNDASNYSWVWDEFDD